MNILLFSDLHYHESQEFPFKDIAESVLSQIENYAVANGVSHVIHLGDLYHNRTRMPVRVIKPLSNRFYDWTRRFSLFLLKGNPMHEGENEDYNGNLFPTATIIDQPSVRKHDDTHFIFFLPYGPKAVLLKQIQQWEADGIGKRSVRILCTHFALDGARALNYEAPATEALTKKELAWFNHVFAGHYHAHQQPFKNAWHVGSPYRVDFGERLDRKGFIHFKDDQANFIDLYVPGMLQLTFNEGYEDKFSKFEEVKGGVSVEGHLIKVIVKGTDVYLRSFDFESCRKRLMNQGALGVTFKSERTADIREVRQARIHKGDSPERMVDRYLDFMKDNTAGLDINKLRRISHLAMKGEINGK